jgi:hypothetical protein
MPSRERARSYYENVDVGGIAAASDATAADGRDRAQTAPVHVDDNLYTRIPRDDAELHVYVNTIAALGGNVDGANAWTPPKVPPKDTPTRPAKVTTTEELYISVE